MQDFSKNKNSVQNALQVIDSRFEKEFKEEGNITGSINLPFNQIKNPKTGGLLPLEQRK